MACRDHIVRFTLLPILLGLQKLHRYQLQYSICRLLYHVTSRACSLTAARTVQTGSGQRVYMDGQEIDRDIYDDEAFIGVREGEIEGKVLDDLDAEDEEQYEGMDADDEDEEEGAQPATAASLGPQNGEEPQLETVREEEESMDEGTEPQLADMAKRRCARHTDSAVAISWSPQQPKVVVSGGCDDHAYLWTIDQEESAAVQLAGHTDTVACVAIDPSGEVIATGGMDGVTRLWDIASGELKAALEGPTEAIEWLDWHPKGTILALGSQDMTSWMFNCVSTHCMQVFTGHAGAVMAGGFTRDGKMLVTAGGVGDSSVRVWNPKSGECGHVIAAGHHAHDQQGITCMALSEDPAVVATGGEDGVVVVSNVASGKAVAKLVHHHGSVEGVVYVQGLNILVSAGLDGKLVIWDTGLLSPRSVCMHRHGVTCLSVWGSGPLVASGSVDGAVRVFDVRTGDMVVELGGGQGVQCIRCMNQQQVVTGSDDGIVRVYEW